MKTAFSQHILTGSNRNVRSRTQIIVSIFTILFLLASSMGVAADHVVNGHLVEVGPINDENGFPLWYKDSNNLSLELCLEGNNPLCAFPPGEFPDPLSPASFPDNFPGEAFWMLAGAETQTALDPADPQAGPGRAILTLALEAAFSSGEVPIDGDQISFGRVRIWVDNLIPGAAYTVTHPYGVETFTNVTAGRRGIRYVSDIGIGQPGDFSGALDSQIGPFLTWDANILPLAPAGFVGDPDVLHEVTGSPFDTNVFRVEGPVGSFTGSPNLCEDPLLGDDPESTTDCIETKLFSLMGKIATRSGVEIQDATYERPSVDDPNATITVFARSQPGKTINVQVSEADNTLMASHEGQYYATVSLPELPAGPLSVINTSDVPPITKTVVPVDRVTITKAEFYPATGVLLVDAQSSDIYGAPTLTATGYGDLVMGSLVAEGVTVPYPTITVTSSAGGSSVARVVVKGGGFDPQRLVAAAGPDQIAETNAEVTLDGSASSGSIAAYLWTQTGGTPVTLSDATIPNPTFTAPLEPDTLTFKLTVSAPGVSSSDTVTVAVIPPPSVMAVAGPDIEVEPGVHVTLNGTDSGGTVPITTYAWTQISGTPVILSDPSSPTPFFLAPEDDGELTFQLTVSAPGLSSSDTVTITVKRSPFLVASGGEDIEVKAGSLITLNGTNSIGNIPITAYQWTQISGPEVILSDPTSPTPTFTAPNVGGTLIFRLTVSGSGISNSTTVIITVLPPPVWKAFLPVTVTP